MPPSLERTADNIDKYRQLTQSKAIEIVLAAGPYTLDSDLTYQPLEELLKTCTKQRPDVLILVRFFFLPQIMHIAHKLINISLFLLHNSWAHLYLNNIQVSLMVLLMRYQKIFFKNVWQTSYLNSYRNALAHGS